MDGRYPGCGRRNSDIRPRTWQPLVRLDLAGPLFVAARSVLLDVSGFPQVLRLASVILRH
jgi:hypothetical protein